MKYQYFEKNFHFEIFRADSKFMNSLFHAYEIIQEQNMDFIKVSYGLQGRESWHSQTSSLNNYCNVLKYWDT